jgi:hypothetical protein
VSESAREVVMARLLAGRVSPPEAALLLGLSERSIRRLRTAFIARGSAALVQGSRGRTAAHRLDPGLAARVIAFARGNSKPFAVKVPDHQQRRGLTRAS